MGFEAPQISFSTAIAGLAVWYPLRETVVLCTNLGRLFRSSEALPPEGIPIDEFCSRITPGDRRRISVMAQESFETKRSFFSSYGLLDPHGRVRQVQAEGFWIFGTDNAPEMMLTSIQEVETLGCPPETRQHRILDLAMEVLDHAVELRRPQVVQATIQMIKALEGDPGAWTAGGGLHS